MEGIISRIKSTGNDKPLRERVVRRIGVAVGLAGVAVLVAIAVYADRAIERDSATERTYSEEISKTYDFKFGSNPFSPSNATTNGYRNFIYAATPFSIDIASCGTGG